MSRPFLRRLAIVFAASAVLSGIGGAQAEEVLRIGFQKSSTLLTLIRSQGTFERELARQGIRVSWHEFPSGLPLLESLNVATSISPPTSPTPCRCSPRRRVLA